MNVITRQLPRKEDRQVTTSRKTIKTATVAPKKKPRVGKPRAAAALLQAERPHKAASANKPARARDGGNKTDKILDLLKRPDGATLKELVKATGWKPNSVRGFLSGSIGKKMKTPVTSFKTSEGDRAYRLSGQ
jgi:Protein of unknown function (DUF3489)